MQDDANEGVPPVVLKRQAELLLMFDVEGELVCM